GSDAVYSQAVVGNGETLELTSSDVIVLQPGFHAQSGSTFRASIDEASTAGPENSPLSELCYQYRYDHRNRLIEKKIPGKGLEAIVYNNLDQPAMTRDEELKGKGQWLFTKYDAFGRVAYTGNINHTGERSSMEGIFSGAAYHYEKRQGATNVGGKTIYYSNQAKPSGINELYTVNYYDNYDYNPSLSLPSSSQGQTIVKGGSKVQGLATGSLTRVLNTNHWIEIINGYDAKGRLIYTKEQNPYLGTTQTTEHLLDAFTGEVEKTKTTHVKTGTGAITITVEDFYQYDDLGRITLHTQKVNGGNEERIAANTYDELGQLKSKEVGNRKGYTALQEVDYAYNVRGWLKGINNIGSTSKLFNMSLYYHDGNSTDLYNGDISEVRWRTKSTDNAQKSYKYYYDALNRITKAYGGTGSGDNGDKFNLGSSSIPTTYDLNGNITHLFRRGAIVASPSLSNNNHFGSMDNLIYKYQGTSNKLQRIEENSGNDNYGFLDHSTATTEYTYDLNGNLLSDANKGITNITYNHLNLPTEVKFNNSGSQVIKYTYDATGVKLRKAIPGKTTDYAGNFVYEKIGAGANELQFFSTPEGYVSYDNGQFNYVYNYVDHLGNVRLSYTDANQNNGNPVDLQIVQEKNYYPFGLTHQGYNDGGSGLGNDAAKRYGFGGKELQDETFSGNSLDWYDFGARNYNPDLGRWMNLDPLAEAYVNSTPYSYALNNPIFFVDPDGMRVDVSGILEKDDDGNYVNQELAEAFLAFAQSDAGIEFLSHFAEAGQVIAGHEYTESGTFDQQGIDLAYHSDNINYLKGNDSDVQGDKGPNGITRLRGGQYVMERNGKGTIDIYINSQLNTNNQEAKDYSENTNDPMARLLYILSRTETIFHETIQHANSYAEDLTDNCSIDNSNIKGNYNSTNPGYNQHMDGRQPGSLYLEKVLPAMINMHREGKTGLSEDEIKTRILNYRN
ncbi:RHS repeat domain-containing protein, partial [Zunongwangia pacifica]